MSDSRKCQNYTKQEVNIAKRVECKEIIMYMYVD